MSILVRSMYLCFFRYSDRRSFRRSGRCNLWHSGQVSGIQTEGAFRPIFRYSDQSCILANLSMFRSNKFPMFRSMQLVDSGHASGIHTEVAFRPIFRYSERSGVQGNFPMFRSKKFPTFKSTQLVAFRPISGIQTEVAFRPIFRCSDRRNFRRSGRYNLWHSG